MLLYSWNVNGIRACWAKGQLAQLLAGPGDIFCLQEVKAQESQSPIDSLEINQYWSPAKTKKGYSGSLVLSRRAANHHFLDFLPEVAAKYPKLADKFGDSNQEGRLISLDYDNFYLVNVYSPNSKGDLSRLALRQEAWDPALADHCQILQKEKPVLLCGDLNVAHQAIDLARPKENEGKHGYTPQERQGLSNLLAKAQLVDSYRQLWPEKTDGYTWWSHWGQARQRNVGWRIDYWLVADQYKNQIKRAEIHREIEGSDHCPVSLEINV